MSFNIPETEPGLERNEEGLHVPADGGITKWFFGDTYTMKLTSGLTNGSLGLMEASVPPGGGPIPHTHAAEDEIFYLMTGELEFLMGEKVFTASAGDVVFIPRTVAHRFRNNGVRPATMLFLYTPGGAENIFIEAGDEPEPGKAAPFWGPERLPMLAPLMDKYGIAPA
jgi:quercetin dioxygenase-like cupin family protein